MVMVDNNMMVAKVVKNQIDGATDSIKGMINEVKNMDVSPFAKLVEMSRLSDVVKGALDNLENACKIIRECGVSTHIELYSSVERFDEAYREYQSYWQSCEYFAKRSAEYKARTLLLENRLGGRPNADKSKTLNDMGLGRKAISNIRKLINGGELSNARGFAVIIRAIYEIADEGVLLSEVANAVKICANLKYKDASLTKRYDDEKFSPDVEAMKSKILKT